MATEHKDIVDAERHPPKGASTASAGEVPVSDGAGDVTWTVPEPKGAAGATAGKVYVSDGAGSGSFQHKSGWQYVTDGTYTSGSKLAVTSGTRTKVTIDSATSSGENITLWNSTTNKLETEGENYCYHVRFAFKASTAASNPYVDIEFNIGGAVGIIAEQSQTLQKGGGTTNYILLSTEIFTGSTFVTNGMEIYITPSGNVDFWDFELLVVRAHRANAG